MPILEVRCCCVPEKLLGWLPVSDLQYEAGVMLDFVLRTPMQISAFVESSTPVQDDLQLLRLPIAWMNHPQRGRFLAIKSEETPIEKLRLIPGFRERRRR